MTIFSLELAGILWVLFCLIKICDSKSGCSSGFNLNKIIWPDLDTYISNLGSESKTGNR